MNAAILVGINNYLLGWEPLLYAESDCRTLATTLRRFDFPDRGIRVLTGCDLESIPIRARLLATDLVQKPADESLDLLLFYFAGHGLQAKGKSYLVPWDVVPADP